MPNFEEFGFKVGLLFINYKNVFNSDPMGAFPGAATTSNCTCERTKQSKTNQAMRRSKSP